VLITLQDIEGHDFTRDVLLHLSIAFVVAVVVMLAVEMQSTRRRTREMKAHRTAIAESVWQAVVGRMVPETVVREIDAILKVDFIRERCRFTVTFQKPYEGMDPGFIVVRREVVYTLVNVTGSSIQAPIRSQISPVHAHIEGQIDGERRRVARHLRLKVGQLTIPLSLERGTLTKDEHGDPLVMSYDLRMDVGARVEIYICSEEALQRRDQCGYFQLTPIDGLTFTINDSAVKDLVEVQEVRLAHPNWRAFKPSEDGVYSYEGALLPGQGVVFRWKDRSEEKPKG
jgi:hypothetical protein